MDEKNLAEMLEKISCSLCMVWENDRNYGLAVNTLSDRLRDHAKSLAALGEETKQVSVRVERLETNHGKVVELLSFYNKRLKRLEEAINKPQRKPRKARK